MAYAAAIVGAFQSGFVQALGAAAPLWQECAAEFRCLDPHRSSAAFATQPPNLLRWRGSVEVIMLTHASKMKALPRIVNVDQPARKADGDGQPNVISLVIAAAGHALDQTLDERHRSARRQWRGAVAADGGGPRSLAQRLDLFGWSSASIVPVPTAGTVNLLACRLPLPDLGLCRHNGDLTSQDLPSQFAVT